MKMPNRRERRKIAKDLGLLKKGTKESSERSKSIGKLIHLRNLTEQRNANKKS